MAKMKFWLISPSTDKKYRKWFLSTKRTYFWINQSYLRCWNTFTTIIVTIYLYGVRPNLTDIYRWLMFIVLEVNDGYSIIKKLVTFPYIVRFQVNYNKLRGNVLVNGVNHVLSSKSECKQDWSWQINWNDAMVEAFWNISFSPESNSPRQGCNMNHRVGFVCLFF